MSPQTRIRYTQVYLVVASFARYTRLQMAAASQLLPQLYQILTDTLEPDRHLDDTFQEELLPRFRELGFASKTQLEVVLHSSRRYELARKLEMAVTLADPNLIGRTYIDYVVKYLSGKERATNLHACLPEWSASEWEKYFPREEGDGKPDRGEQVKLYLARREELKPLVEIDMSVVSSRGTINRGRPVIDPEYVKQVDKKWFGFLPLGGKGLKPSQVIDAFFYNYLTKCDYLPQLLGGYRYYRLPDGKEKELFGRLEGEGEGEDQFFQLKMESVVRFTGNSRTNYQELFKPILQEMEGEKRLQWLRKLLVTIFAAAAYSTFIDLLNPDNGNLGKEDLYLALNLTSSEEDEDFWQAVSGDFSNFIRLIFREWSKADGLYALGLGEGIEERMPFLNFLVEAGQAKALAMIGEKFDLKGAMSLELARQLDYQDLVKILS